jgi:hypothetical protein
MHIQLPKYLDDFIFNKLDGKYLTQTNVDDNLNNDSHKNKIYIGTYLPRSFAESYNIFSDLFLNSKIKENFNQKNTINILDIGAGTGGNLLGLLTALRESFGTNKQLNVYTIEGNAEVIEYQKKFVDKFKSHNNYSGINLININRVFTNKNNFIEVIITTINSLHIKFDIISSFKFFTEFYNRNNDDSFGLYYVYSYISSSWLTDDGLSVLLDVTTTDLRQLRPFTPFIVSREIKAYLRNNNGLKIILPKPCALWHSDCQTENAFSKEFSGFLIRVV